MIITEKMPREEIINGTVPCTCSADALSMVKPFIYTCIVNQWLDCGAPGSNAHSNEFTEPVEFCAKYSSISPALEYLAPRAIL